ncbi:MAG: hypothetical protein ACXWZS_14345 [Gemmatirosa sp.]
MLRRTIAVTAGLAALAACGGGNENANTVADSAAAVGPSVDSMSKMDDSSYVKAQQRLDSLKAAGVSPADGIDSTAARARESLANDSTRDTLRYPQGRKP